MIARTNPTLIITGRWIDGLHPVARLLRILAWIVAIWAIPVTLITYGLLALSIITFFTG